MAGDSAREPSLTAAEITDRFDSLSKIVEYLRGTPWSRVHPYPGAPEKTNPVYAAALEWCITLARRAAAGPAHHNAAERLHEAARAYAASVERSLMESEHE